MADMNAISSAAPRSATRQRATLGLILSAVALLPFALLGMAAVSGCSQAEMTTDVAKASAVGKSVLADASSPAGKQILGDVTSGALSLGLAITSERTNIPDDIAAVEGAASIVRDYEGLPVAPSAATVAKAAGIGAGDASVASKLLKGTAQSAGIATLISNAKTAAAVQKVALSADAITEALGRGLDAVANAVPPITLAGSPGEAP